MKPSHSPENKTLFQTFEWHTDSTPQTPHYPRLTSILPSLAQLGITAIWLPPGCKANNPQGNGYDCADLWDLGEFDQKGSRSTKWGSREELDSLIRLAKKEGVDVVWDAVLNHKQAGDATEETWAVEVDSEDRRYEICPPKKIESWLRYDFPGREREGMKYSKMKWRAEHFNGTDWDQRAEKNAMYKLIDDPGTLPKPFVQPRRPSAVKPPPSRGRLGLLRQRLKGSSETTRAQAAPVRRPGKGWADDVDDQNGNNDYLLFSNIDYAHPEVREDITKWGEWMIKEVGVNGFRLDAVQHFSYRFTRDWIQKVNAASESNDGGKSAFVVGEVWTGEVTRLQKWLDAVQHPNGPQVYAYDAPLVYNFSRVSEDLRMKSRNTDLRTIVRDSLLERRPKAAVTLVTNHDTQPGQACYTPMLRDLKPLWYAFILLTDQGYPCVFWGDLYGTKGPHAEPPACLVAVGRGMKKSLLPDLMMCRKLFAYGDQTYYEDSAACIGWTRAGTNDRPGCAAVMSILPPTAKPTVMKMRIGRPGEVWVDVLHLVKNEVIIDAKGYGNFPCGGMSVAVFVEKGADGTEKFPVRFDLDVYGS